MILLFCLMRYLRYRLLWFQTDHLHTSHYALQKYSSARWISTIRVRSSQKREGQAPTVWIYLSCCTQCALHWGTHPKSNQRTNSWRAHQYMRNTIRFGRQTNNHHVSQYCHHHKISLTQYTHHHTLMNIATRQHAKATHSHHKNNWYCIVHIHHEWCLNYRTHNHLQSHKLSIRTKKNNLSSLREYMVGRFNFRSENSHGFNYTKNMFLMKNIRCSLIKGIIHNLVFHQ